MLHLKQQQTASGKNKLKAKKKGIFTSATKAEMNYNFYGIPALCLERKKKSIKIHSFYALFHSNFVIYLFFTLYFLLGGEAVASAAQKRRDSGWLKMKLAPVELS